MQAGDDVNPEETDAPPFVRGMEGKSYTFQVKVGPYNFTANHQSFTISRILGEGERAPQPEFVEDVILLYPPLPFLLWINLTFSFYRVVTMTMEMTMEMTTTVLAWWDVRWRMVDVASPQDHLLSLRRHGRHKWEGRYPFSIIIKFLLFFFNRQLCIWYFSFGVFISVDNCVFFMNKYAFGISLFIIPCFVIAYNFIYHY